MDMVVEDYHGPQSARNPLQDVVDEEEKKEEIDSDPQHGQVETKVRRKTTNMSRYAKHNQMM